MSIPTPPTASAAPQSPRIYACQEWGARPARRRAFPASGAEGIVIHHTAGPNITPSSRAVEEIDRTFDLARQIQRHHMDRNGWADTGQHFLVSRGGVICEGRHGSASRAALGLVVQGAHAGDDEANAQRFGIETEGSYHLTRKVPLAQWNALAELCAWLAWWGDFDTQNILPHSHYRATECPGYLRDLLPDLRRAAHDRKVELIAALGRPR